MAELTVKFKTSGFSSAARTLGRSFDSRFNDYQGIRKKVLNEPTSRSYLNSSGSYLQKKIDSLDSKRDKLDGFKRQVEGFCEEAKRVDKGVANRIKSDAKDVYKTLGIKTGFWATTAAFFKGTGKAIWNGLKDTWGAIKAGAKTVWEAVKDFYEKHKDIINVIITAVAVIVVAVACILTGGLFAIVGTGLLVGLISQTVKDLVNGKLSTWESYLGSSIGSGAAALAYASGNVALGGALDSGVSSLVTLTLKKLSGKETRSWVEISLDSMLEAAIGGAIGWCTGKVLDSKLAKKAFGIFDKGVLRIFGGNPKHGILTGQGSWLATYKQQMTNLWRGNTQHFAKKTLGKIIGVTAFKTLTTTIRKKVVDSIKNSITKRIMDHVVRPIVITPIKKHPLFNPIAQPIYVRDPAPLNNLQKILKAI